MQPKLPLPLLACAVLLLISAPTALAHGASSSTFAGLEIFPGVRVGDITYGTTFVCKTLQVEGVCEATVRYRGTPGLGSQVTILGGQWWWKQTGPDITHRGRVLGGQVVWPPSLSAPGCNGQPGVAQVTATIALGLSSAPGGTIVACLDDTHRSGTLDPATFTGIITLSAAH
jgi:hypothetical protein